MTEVNWPTEWDVNAKQVKAYRDFANGLEAICETLPALNGRMLGKRVNDKLNAVLLEKCGKYQGYPLLSAKLGLHDYGTFVTLNIRTNDRVVTKGGGSGYITMDNFDITDYEHTGGKYVNAARMVGKINTEISRIRAEADKLESQNSPEVRAEADKEFLALVDAIHAFQEKYAEPIRKNMLFRRHISES